jgi:hypothetical protein
VVLPAPYRPSNPEIADQLDEVGGLLRVQRADEWRIRAFHDAAHHLRSMPESVVEILDREGRPGLIALPTIGRGIAAAIEEMAWSGRYKLLDRLRGEVTPEELLMTLPGMGETLARRIHEELGVETLEDLELAAHDGRLERVEGFGPRRAHAVRDLLAAQLSRSTRRRARQLALEHRASALEAPASSEVSLDEPPEVDLLLDLDTHYRELAKDGELPTIAPRRFNPAHEAWLPVWHVTEEDWHFTVLFSNSKMAHDLDKTRDWVVIYWERDGHEDQATVVTEYRGPLKGRRVVRGRERECLSHWARDTERRLRERRWERTG